MQRHVITLPFMAAVGAVVLLALSDYFRCGEIVSTAGAAQTKGEKVTMRFGYTLCYVSDVDKTLTFYESAFGLRRKFYNLEGDNGYGELDTGPTTLGFVSYALAKSTLGGASFVEPAVTGPAPAVDIGFVTNDVGAAYEKAVKQGAAPVAAPDPKPWGQTVAYVRDLNGFLVTIASEIAK